MHDWIASFRALRRYAKAFEELGVDGSMLAQVTDDDLKTDLGVSVRLHRVKILDAVKHLLLGESLQRNKNGAFHHNNFGKIEMMPHQASVFPSTVTDSSVDDADMFPLSINQSGSSHSNVETHSNGSQGSNLRSTLRHYAASQTGSSSGHNKGLGSDLVYTAPVEEATVVVLFSCPLVDEARQPVPLLAHDTERKLICASLGRQSEAISTHVSCEHRLVVCRCHYGMPSASLQWPCRSAVFVL